MFNLLASLREMCLSVECGGPTEDVQVSWVPLGAEPARDRAACSAIRSPTGNRPCSVSQTDKANFRPFSDSLPGKGGTLFFKSLCIYLLIHCVSTSHKRLLSSLGLLSQNAKLFHLSK